MRWLIPLLAVILALAGAESAQALSCRPPDSTFTRFQEADVAVVASLVSAEPIAPEEPLGGPLIPGWGPTGPVVVARYRVQRVFKADSDGPKVGDEFSRTGQVPRGTSVPPWHSVVGWLIDREDDGSLDGPLATGPCSPGPLTRNEMRGAALLDRYGAGNGAESSGCSFRGETCWSVKRKAREVVLRIAGYPRSGYRQLHLLDVTDKRYKLCVRAPDGSRSCRRFALVTDSPGLLSSRVRWSRRFPDRGRGVYRVRWLPAGSEVSDYTREQYRQFPLLEFRR